jgi:hypothetical protein
LVNLYSYFQKKKNCGKNEEEEEEESEGLHHMKQDSNPVIFLLNFHCFRSNKACGDAGFEFT